MPVYNEANTVDKILERVLLQRPVQEVIAVDDASRTDVESPRSATAVTASPVTPARIFMPLSFPYHGRLVRDAL